MGNRNARQRVNNRIFYLAIAIWYVICAINETALVENTFITNSIIVMNWMVRLLLIAIILRQTYYKKDLFRLGVFVCVVLLSYYFCRYQELVWILLFVLAAQNVEMREVVKVTTIVTAITVLIVVLLAIVGVISNELTYSTNIYSGAYAKVQLYGFSHHNFIGGRVLLLYTCYVFLRYNTLKLPDYGVGIAAAVILYVVFKSRTAVALLVVCIFIVFTLKMLEHLERKQGKALVKAGIYSIMLFSIIFSFAVTFGYQKRNAICIAINTLIYKRFFYASKILSEYGISFWGQRVNLVSSITAEKMGVNALILDNAYMHMIIRCGWAFFLVIMYGYFFVVNKSIKEKNYKIAAIVALYFLCGISEKWLFTISYNPFVILISAAVFSGNRCLIETDEKEMVSNVVKV